MRWHTPVRLRRLPLAGGDTSGLAKPVPRYLLEGITPVVGWLMRYRGEAEFTPPRAA